MSNEVKVVYADVEESLSVMENATSSLKPTAEPAIEGNTLDVVTKLNELAQELEQILTSYQAVLQSNIQTTRNSVHYMREQDQRISTNISGAVSGPRRLMD
ncbi:YwqI/YxiC family protein [Ureibacillus sp. NPDC094379]